MHDSCYSRTRPRDHDVIPAGPLYTYLARNNDKLSLQSSHHARVGCEMRSITPKGRGGQLARRGCRYIPGCGHIVTEGGGGSGALKSTVGRCTGVLKSISEPMNEQGQGLLVNPVTVESSDDDELSGRYGNVISHQDSPPVRKKVCVRDTGHAFARGIQLVVDEASSGSYHVPRVMQWLLVVELDKGCTMYPVQEGNYISRVPSRLLQLCLVNGNPTRNLAENKTHNVVKEALTCCVD